MDYNIYIHSNGSGGITNKTVPWENRQDGGASETSSFTMAQSAMQNIQKFATTGFQGYVETGVSMLARAIPAVALTVAATKVTDNVLTTGFSHVETYTGHYEYSMNFNNFKTLISNALNPIGLAMKHLRRQYQFELQNKKIEQERILVGNSILDISVKGV